MNESLSNIEENTYRSLGKELVVTIDAKQAIDMVSRMLEPGAVLMDKKAMEKLYELMDEFRTKEAMYGFFEYCGGVIAKDLSND